MKLGGHLMRGKKLAWNTTSSFIFQITTLICGFILPRLILQKFGSEINGLVNSIVQFLQVISFLELGVGAVVQSSLYKPIAENNSELISKIIVSAGKFFKRLAVILLIYVILLMLIYPVIIGGEFGWLYTATLVAAISISSLAQYYIGVVDRLLLTADQRGYIQYNSQTIAVIINTIACVILIELGASIHIVKLTTSLIYLVRPLILRWYINQHYSIDRKVTYDKEPIKQKWNGVAQHVAAVVLDGTDTIVLTVFAKLSDVSIYSVYYLVVYGVKQLFMAMTSGVHSLIGELWAKQELGMLKKAFGWLEWSIHTGTVLVFGCTGMLVSPFVQVYTSGVNDVNYVQPIFAVLITMANAVHCLRLPYSIMILAGSHYKQTQHNYVIAAILNLVISIVTVKSWGLIGVALGTLIAMFYQTIWMARYNSKNLMKWPFRSFLKQIAADIITVIISVLLTERFVLSSVTYTAWILLAIKTTVIWIIVVVIVNLIFYKDKINKFFSVMNRKLSSI